jgi:hypothetical protein
LQKGAIFWLAHLSWFSPGREKADAINAVVIITVEIAASWEIVPEVRPTLRADDL